MENHTAHSISSETYQMLSREDNFDYNNKVTGVGKISPSNYIPDNFINKLLLQASPFSGEIFFSVLTFAFTLE